MKVFCILSDERVFLSRSPVIFSTVMKRVGIKGAYVPFRVEPEQIGQALQSIRTLHISGANVTVPYKELVIPFLDELSEGARIIGAVNTIVRTDKVLKGYNTNAIGFMDALSAADYEVEGKSALVFGTGGAARAVVFILNWLRADSVVVAGRNQEKTLEIVNSLGGEARAISELYDHTIHTNIVVNATAVSSSAEAPEFVSLLEKIELPSCELVLDLNYGRSSNFWQEMARQKGIRFMDGLPSLAYQARRTFALWTGIQVAPEEFLKALESET